MNLESIASDPAVLGASRKGSPFAPGTARPAGPLAATLSFTASQESIGEGVWRETAVSAAFASLMLILFATLGWIYFPAGGLMVAILGLIMGVFGMSSRHLRLAATCLIIHLVLLVACYLRIL